MIPQVTGQGIFNLFDPVRGASYFSDSIASCHGIAISKNENLGGDSIFKNAV